MEKIDVLDHGFVRLVEHMGSDLSIVRAARVGRGTQMSPGAAQESAEAAPLRRSTEVARAAIAYLPEKWQSPENENTRTFVTAIALAFEEVTREDDELLTLLGRMVYAFSGWGNDEDAARLKELIAKRISP